MESGILVILSLVMSVLLILIVSNTTSFFLYKIKISGVLSFLISGILIWISLTFLVNYIEVNISFVYLSKNYISNLSQFIISVYGIYLGRYIKSEFFNSNLENSRCILIKCLLSFTIPFLTLGFVINYLIALFEVESEKSVLGTVIFYTISVSTCSIPVLSVLFDDWGDSVSVLTKKISILFAIVADIFIVALLMIVSGYGGFSDFSAPSIGSRFFIFLLLFFSILLGLARGKGREYFSHSAYLIFIYYMYSYGVDTFIISMCVGFLFGKLPIFMFVDSKIFEEFKLIGLKIYCGSLAWKADPFIIVSNNLLFYFTIFFVGIFIRFFFAYQMAYHSGLSSNESKVVGRVVNSKGLMEIIILDMGVNFGFINDSEYFILLSISLFVTIWSCIPVGFIKFRGCRYA